MISPDFVTKAVAGYKAAVTKGSHPAIVMTYRTLRPFFSDKGASTALSRAFRAWVGVAIPDSPTFALKVDSVLPWALAICQGPPWPSDLPAHAIPVSVVEVAYLSMAPSAVKPMLHKEIVTQWERTHTKPVSGDVVEMFKASGWDVETPKAWSSDAGSSFFDAAQRSARTPTISNASGSGLTPSQSVIVGMRGNPKGSVPSTGSTKAPDGSATNVSLDPNDVDPA